MQKLHKMERMEFELKYLITAWMGHIVTRTPFIQLPLQKLVLKTPVFQTHVKMAAHVIQLKKHQHAVVLQGFMESSVKLVS